MDPLKFSINLVDNVSSGLAEIRRNIEKMKDQEIKVKLKVENQEEINMLSAVSISSCPISERSYRAQTK